MAESSINVTEGSGKRLHTFDRTIGAVLVQDQFAIPAEYPYATYVVVAESSGIAVGHIFQVMAGPSKYLRVRRVTVIQRASATASAACRIDIVRLTTAGTGGTVASASTLDPADSAFSGAAMQDPTTLGTESVFLSRHVIGLTSAVPSSVNAIQWTALPNMKGIVVPPGTSNGVALKVRDAVAGASVAMTVEVIETDFA